MDRRKPCPLCGGSKPPGRGMRYCGHCSEWWRFFSKIDIGDCWTWIAQIGSDGYGRFMMKDGATTTAHRAAWLLLVGPIPEGHELDHLCRNKACVNPDHLEPVTHAVNVSRGHGRPAHNGRRTHCKRGHAFTPSNTYTTTYGGRQCRACVRITHRRAYTRKRVEERWQLR